MGEEFEAAGVCGGGNWWNPSRVGFGSSPCNSSININDHIGSYGWAGELVDLNGGGGGGGSGGARSSDDSSDGNGNTGDAMGTGISSSSITDWNQSLIRANAILQEDLNYHQETPLPVDNFDDQVNFPTSYGYSSTLLQTLFDSNSPPEQSGFDTGPMNYSSPMNNYRTSLSEFSPSTLPKLSYNMVKPKEQVSGQLHLSNSTPFWNATSSALSDVRASFFSSSQPPFEEKPNCANLTAKSNHEEIQKSVSMKKGCSEPVFKRPRFQTPSPLPTFKVRKEKLGDRITALQQLVSPFGKTDTASVLHEAIEYIKLLHDQVNVFSMPYMKNGASMQCQQNPEKVKETEERAKQDLKTRGLCLVPVSSTFPVAAETTADFWIPNFGGAFR